MFETVIINQAVKKKSLEKVAEKTAVHIGFMNLFARLPCMEAFRFILPKVLADLQIIFYFAQNVLAKEGHF